jgi:hypothetical protein
MHAALVCVCGVCVCVYEITLSECLPEALDERSFYRHRPLLMCPTGANIFRHVHVVHLSVVECFACKKEYVHEHSHVVHLLLNALHVKKNMCMNIYMLCICC